MSTESDGLSAALKRFETLYPRAIDLSLGRLDVLLARLGNPQNSLPPVIHVAGTNGKGSTVAFIRAMAEAAGLRVSVYSSPHLVRFNERIRLAGQLVGDAPLVGWLDAVFEAANGGPITHFEATTAAALLAFAQTPADLLVLEVGLGGRFDATNVIEAPAVSVIAPVDHDHKEFLGTDIARIAWEKAGIIKPGCPVVSAAQGRTQAGVIALEAAQRGAPLRVLGEAHRVESAGASMRYVGRALTTPWTAPSLPGLHQHANAGLAALALETFGDSRITGEAMARGIRDAVWPARMQRLAPGPLTAGLGEAEVWLDGGHNPHAARAIAALLGQAAASDTVLITAMMANKDRAGFFAALRGCARRVITIPNAEGHAGADPHALAEAAQAAGFDAQAASGLEAALAAARGARRVLICGSLYLAGEVLRANGQVPD